jgi:hypothetical protein
MMPPSVGIARRRSSFTQCSEGSYSMHTDPSSESKNENPLTFSDLQGLVEDAETSRKRQYVIAGLGLAWVLALSGLTFYLAILLPQYAAQLSSIQRREESLLEAAKETERMRAELTKQIAGYEQLVEKIKRASEARLTTDDRLKRLESAIDVQGDRVVVRGLTVNGSCAVGGELSVQVGPLRVRGRTVD